MCEDEYKRAYIVLSSIEAETALFGGRLRWNFNLIGKTGAGNCTFISPIQKIRGIICRGMSIRWPINGTFAYHPDDGRKVLHKATTNNITNDIKNHNFSNTILFEELDAQSVIGRSGFKYHFSFYPAMADVTYDSSPFPTVRRYEYLPVGKNPCIMFDKPILLFSSVTVKFSNGLSNLLEVSGAVVHITMEFLY
jgi:hypothetical protein